MKILNLALTITTFFALYSHDACSQTTTSETNTNGLLYDNAKASREDVNKKDTGPAQEIRALGVNQAAPANLTDQEKQLSEGYIHQGRANQIITEKCSGAMGSVCSGNEGDHKFMGMDPNMVKAISQAYAMIGALGGDSFAGLTKGDEVLAKEQKKIGSESGTEKGKIDKKANDYCKFIPTVTEGIATAVQTAKSKELTAEVGNGDTAQRDALLKAAKSHDSRAKMAQIQAAGWWGGAACYIANASMGNFATDKNLIIKAGAATLLGAFFQNEVSANKSYAEKTRNIAKSLPGQGDCNPITDNICYCSQPSTENDPTYCMANLHAKKIATTSYRVACTDDQLKIDSACNCEKTNTCFDSMLEMQGQGSFDLGSAYATSPFKAIRSLARGELVGGTLNSQSYDQTAAIAKQGLRDLASKLPNETSLLNKEQKAIADAMIARGVPAGVASLMVQNPPSAAATNSAMAKLTSGAAMKMAAVAPGKASSNVLDFTSGKGLGYKGTTKGASGSGADDILAQLKPGSKTPASSKVLEFAQKAQNQAMQNGQIRKEKDTPIFDIISLRYQTSGRRLLEVDANN